MNAAVRSTELRRDAEGRVRHGSEWLQLWADPDSVRSPEARARALAAARAVTDLERALAGAFRAVAGRAEATLGFTDGMPMLAGAHGTAPLLGTPPDPALLAATRGAADAAAARLRYHDPGLHAQLAPAEPLARALFDALEGVRAEALAARHRPGLRENLDAYAAWRLERLGFANARLPADLAPDEAMAVVMRGRLAGAGAELPSLGLRLWDRFVGAELAAECDALAATLAEQRGFADAALRFIAALFRALGRARQPGLPPAPPRPIAPDADDTQEHRPRTKAAIPAPAPEEPSPAAAPRGGAAPQPAPPQAYAPFTTAYDRVLRAADLAPPDQLVALRARLDGEIASARSLLARLATRLQRRLLARQRRAWDFDQDEGLLDAARLERVVTRPEAALSFKREREAAFRDTVVALLVDCSGSMRGRPILLAAVAADVTARALERVGVACEVLGFTTADWSGGESGAAWVRAGCPPGPGRLGDVRHLIFKSADESWRAARNGLAAMLKPDVLRENVDGEALAWAHARLLARREERRVLVVISDGAPAEASTLKANPPDILSRHLDAVIGGIHAQGRVQLRAIGIRHDVSRHYRDAVTIDTAQLVGPALIEQLGSVFDEPGRRQRVRQS